MSTRAAANFPLPQELVDHVLDHLHDDPLTLSSCSLVCHSWLPTTRYHLFSTVAFRPRLSDSPIGQPVELCPRLHEILLVNPNLARYIRHLEIWEGAPGAHPSRCEMGYVIWIARETTLPLVLSKLKYLRRLELCGNVNISYSEFSDTLRSALSNAFSLPSLVYLRVHNVSFPTSFSFVSMLSRLHSLRGLALSSVSFRDSEPLDDFPGDLPSPPDSEDVFNQVDSNPSHALTRSSTSVLEFLTLDFIDCDQLGAWLLGPHCPLQYHALRELRISHSQSTTMASTLLRLAGVSLEHLHLKPGPWDVHAFDLGVNPCLRSIRLTLEDTSNAIPWVTALFSTVAVHNSLERIGLEFFTDLKRMSGWSEVDHVLTRPEILKGLWKVDLGLFASPYHSEFLKVKRRLKLLSKKRVGKKRRQLYSISECGSYFLADPDVQEPAVTSTEESKESTSTSSCERAASPTPGPSRHTSRSASPIPLPSRLNLRRDGAIALSLSSSSPSQSPESGYDVTVEDENDDQELLTMYQLGVKRKKSSAPSSSSSSSSTAPPCDDWTPRINRSLPMRQ